MNPNPILALLTWLAQGASVVTGRRVLFGAAAALFTPAVLGVADAWAYVVMGSIASGIEWNSDRVSAAWLLALLGIAAATAGAIYPEPEPADPPGVVKS